MPIPEHVHRFWRALDELFAVVRPTPWGAVVTDGRFPRIWDINYGRIDRPDQTLRLEDVARDLVPALEEAGVSTFHVVSFHPEATSGLLAELSTLGHRLSWDLVMDAGPDDTIGGPSDVEVEGLAPGGELWSRVADSLELFGVDPGDAVDQLRDIEESVLAPGGKRWYGVRDEEGTIASLGAVVTLEGVGYIDNVATFPHARGRGFAAAITSRAVREARERGAEHVCLFSDPEDEPVVRLYERLGFHEAGRMASTRGPSPPEARTYEPSTNL